MISIDYYYVYKWQDINNGNIIYVGQGHGKRYKEIKRKNPLFEDYIKNHECVPIIIHKNLSLEKSIELESVCVKFYKSIGQCCCVRTADGYRSMPKEINPNYKNGSALKYRYSVDENLRNKTKHVGLKNGRCRKIQIIQDDKILNFDYIVDCANYMRDKNFSNGSIGTIQSAISKSIRLNKKYCGLYFKYLD